MQRIGVGEQEAHGDGLDPLRLQRPNRTHDFVAIQRLDYRTVRIEALADLMDAVAREQHLRRGSKNVEDLVAAPLPADLVDVAKAARGQKTGAHALALQQRVERRGRTVQDQGYGVRLHTRRRARP